MTWLDGKFVAALLGSMILVGYAIAGDRYDLALLGVAMIATVTVTWGLYRRATRKQREESVASAAPPLPLLAQVVWITFWVMLMAFMAWTIYRFDY